MIEHVGDNNSFANDASTEKMSLPNIFFFSQREILMRRSHVNDATMYIKLPIIHRPSKIAKKNLQTEIHHDLKTSCVEIVVVMYPPSLWFSKSKKCTFADELMK